MTIGEFKEWCQENGINDDALLIVYDAERFDALHVEEEVLEAVSDTEEDQEFVQINLAQLLED